MPDEDPAKLRALLDLSLLVDGLIETALQLRESLAEAMQRILPALCERVGARGAFVRSFSEDLTLTLFVWPKDLVIPELETVLDRAGEQRRETFALEVGTDLVVAQPLDVAGEWFGSAGLVVRRSATSADSAHATAVLETACEELDNFLHAIRAARERHRVMMQLGTALGHRVIGQGLRSAVKILTEAVALDRLLLVCVAEEDQAGTLHVQVFEQGELAVDTMGSLPPHEDERAIVDEARRYLLEGDKTLVDRFGFRGAREEVLINGVTRASLVGKVLVTAKNAGFNTYDRELLAGFAGFVRQRVVDFNKEWRTLARSFRPEHVARLLHHPDYAKRHLAPREAEVAILYVDISGFTSLSERVLRSPAAVAELVEIWSRESVNLVWKHGGVFDKMVGDCVIGLFGPPFYDEEPTERLAAALRCAIEIRAMTQSLPERPGFEHLKDAGLGVSTGVNLAPLFVGQFGPNDNFTGFSSGMNNTARLQGCAAKDEILVMEDAAARLASSSDFSFGPERSAKVKNVADPLKFRALS